MIDISNVVMKIIKDAVSTAYPNCAFTSDEPAELSYFPTVTVRESDNRSYVDGLDNTYEEEYANVMYDVNVYANNKDGKRAEAKAIINLLDNAMIRAGFKRMMKQELPNIDRTVYRIMARYEAVTSAPYTDEQGNTVHDIYRR